MLLELNRHPFIDSMYRVDALRTPSRLRTGYFGVGEEVRFIQAQVTNMDIWQPHVSFEH